MLQIILFILKLIGWILLVILGLLVLAAVVLLFTPLRYRVEAGCGGTLSTLEVDADFRLLFRLVSGKVRYQDETLSWNIRAAWIRLGNQAEAEEVEESIEESLEEAEKDIREEGEKVLENIPAQETEAEAEITEDCEQQGVVEEYKKSPAENSEDTAEKKTAAEKKTTAEKRITAEKKTAVEKKTTAEERITAEKKTAAEKKTTAEERITAEKKTAVEEKTAGDENQPKKRKKAGKARTEPDSMENSDTVQKECNTKETMADKIAGVFKKIKYTFDRICDKIRTLLEKAESVKAFLTDEVHQSAFLKCLAELKKMAIRLRPKRIRGKVHFGFEDPSLTGRVLAGVSLLYPYWGEHICCSPDFENKVLEGEVSVEGSLRLLPAAALGWNLLWNKNVRRTAMDIKRFFLSK